MGGIKMVDKTELHRKVVSVFINAGVESSDEDAERMRLEKKHGKVWYTKEHQNDFIVNGFLAPFVTVVRNSDNKKGTLLFQHLPRFYFDFQEV